ncbi:hypothetical protein ACFWDI_05715 [Streptomyces sp. NPDC060064]|uniref:hypothetical protein n=1 Tax=Streptomyces sp. NPDC060064 TaxID=3347049 RepID=UPI00368106A0
MAVRATALSLAVYLLAGLLGGPVAAAAELSLLELKKPDAVATAPVKTHRITRPDQAEQHAWNASPKVTWPTPATAQATLPASGPARAGKLPVKLQHVKAKGAGSSGPERAQVQVLDRKTADELGVDGILLAVRPSVGAAGQVKVDVDYSGFRHAYGGDWASRLTLRQVPACALTTPTAKSCSTGTELKTSNNSKTGTLSAAVPLPAAPPAADQAAPVAKSPAVRSATELSASSGTVLLAATAGVSGSSGSFGATSLAPSSSWSAGGSNGGFTWKYDIDTPEVPGAVAPQLNLSYASQSIDGHTAATNNQANGIGDG